MPAQPLATARPAGFRSAGASCRARPGQARPHERTSRARRRTACVRWLVQMFLVVRGADHLLLGVSWSGFRPDGTADGGIPVLVAVDDSARVVLTFPPQHVAEETSPPGTP